MKVLINLSGFPSRPEKQLKDEELKKLWKPFGKMVVQLFQHFFD